MYKNYAIMSWFCLSQHYKVVTVHIKWIDFLNIAELGNFDRKLENFEIAVTYI